MLFRSKDKMTSIGREYPHLSIDVFDKHGLEDLTRVDIDTTTLLSPAISDDDCGDDNSDDEEIKGLTLDVPDKINLECDLHKGGSIFVEGKIEGDVRMKTMHGWNISVSKLRGQSIEMEISSSEEQQRGSKSSFIFVSELLECQALRLKIPEPSSDRIRAKRIHTNKMEIRVGEENSNIASSFSTTDVIEKENKNQYRLLLDEDDSGSICDISSLYLTGDASIDVRQPYTFCKRGHRQRQAVRIKSHHGHVHVQVSAPKPYDTNEFTNDILPIVDLGGKLLN